MFGNKARLTRLPHLQHTENSTQLDLTLRNLDQIYINARLGLEMVVVGTNKSSEVNLNEDTTIDDEYTPAVFSVSFRNIIVKFCKRLVKYCLSSV